VVTGNWQLATGNWQLATGNWNWHLPMTDADFMARALALAERGRGRTSPNPMVGAVVVDVEGVVVGRGSHEFAGGPHAEVHALNDAAERARGGTLYCTLEPCCHTGRTGPCAPRVVEAGIRRVVVAIEDPNPLVAGRGIAHLRACGIDVALGVGAEDSAALNRAFFTVMQRRRPFVTAKVALSLDACVAAGVGIQTRLTGDAADRRVHRERAEVDAIGIGSGTVLADNPQLTARGVYRVRPLVRVVFDGRLRTPPDIRLLSTLHAGPVIIVTSASAVASDRSRAERLQNAGARLQVHDDRGSRPSIAAALERLALDGITSIVIEGGPCVHRAAWDEGVIDRIQVFVTSRKVGASGVPWMPYDAFRLTDLENLQVQPVGDDVVIEGLTAHNVHRPD
jgi:diaminohydroxyphosphoribosylaminopyrimidine deaminase/5-amino-6-(5-phosphoribosylamino)uracil reductase